MLTATVKPYKQVTLCYTSTRLMYCTMSLATAEAIPLLSSSVFEIIVDSLP